MTFRFIHTADIHLDSPLKSLAMRNSRLAEIVSNATRSALRRIVDLCIQERVDALLIAGDLYDGEQKSMKTARFLVDELRRLDEKGIKVFIIRGNHDAESKITKELIMPKGVHLFTSKGQAVTLERPAGSLPVVIHGVSFKKPKAPKSLLPQYPDIDPAAINIGMMHTSLDGSAEHDPYAPCKLTDLQASGHDYWALGHIHKRFIHETGNCAVVMPGIPQGRDIGEAGVKSVTLVSIADDRRITCEKKAINLAQFEEICVSLEGHEDWEAAIETISNQLVSKQLECEAEHLVARVKLEGTTSLSWRLRRDAVWLDEEIKSRIEGKENCWIDKVLIECQDNIEAVPNSADPLIELADLITDEIKNSTAFAEQAAGFMQDIQKKIPGKEMRNELGSDEATMQDTITELALAGAKDVLSNLRGHAASEKD